MIAAARRLLPYIIVFALGFAAGYFSCRHFIEPVTIEKPPAIKTEYKTRTETKIVYVPKADKEDADIDVSIGKPELKVVVNGQEAVIQKSDDEKSMFNKNKLELTQTSAAKLDITVPTIDRTKHWGVGAGLSNNGIAYTLTFPVNKKLHTDGWAYHDSDTTAAGIMIRF
jgi:hypothetical protein